jgi:hypothetical protein
VISLAASPAHASQSPGLFMLVWGLTASAFGLATATNFRGFADNFARRAEASSAGLRKLPPWKWQQPRKPGEAICGISIAMGQMTIGIVALFAGGLPSLALPMEDKPTGTGPDDIRDSEDHNQDPSGPGGPVA